MPQSLRGQPFDTLKVTSHGITPSFARLLVNRNEVGLHRYQPVRAIYLPDKEFRSTLLPLLV